MMNTEETILTPTEPPRARPGPGRPGTTAAFLEALAVIYRDFGLTSIQARAAALADLRMLDGGFGGAR